MMMVPIFLIHQGSSTKSNNRVLRLMLIQRCSPAPISSYLGSCLQQTWISAINNSSISISEIMIGHGEVTSIIMKTDDPMSVGMTVLRCFYTVQSSLHCNQLHVLLQRCSPAPILFHCRSIVVHQLRYNHISDPPTNKAD